MSTDETMDHTPEVRQSTFTRTPSNGFKSGHAKFGGRARGTRNLATEPLSGVETARKLGFDPVEVMIQIVRHGSIIELDGRVTPVDTQERLKLLREVAPFVEPKCAIKLESTVDHRHTHVDMTAIMMNPELAAAAERLALAMSELPDESPVYDVQPDED